jgi:hypothetical protein
VVGELQLLCSAQQAQCTPMTLLRCGALNDYASILLPAPPNHCQNLQWHQIPAPVLQASRRIPNGRLSSRSGLQVFQRSARPVTNY